VSGVIDLVAGFLSPSERTGPAESHEGFTGPASRSGRFGLTLVTQRFHKEAIKNIQRDFHAIHIQSVISMNSRGRAGIPPASPT